MIVFRNLGKDVPKQWAPDIYYSVEFYDDKADTPYPLGVATVADYPAMPNALDWLTPVLYMVLVNDLCRRQGVATKLVRACLERWPNLYLTEAVTPGGEALERRFAQNKKDEHG